ncbi:myb-like protein X isoform X2 [Carica papaya]|nr:myb-like protein X isoform X2 [Carica papaya]
MDDSINISRLKLKEAESLCSSNQALENSTGKNEPKEADPTELKEDATEPPLPTHLPDKKDKKLSAADHLTIEDESSCKNVMENNDKPAFAETNQHPVTAAPLVQPVMESTGSELEVKDKQNSEACADKLATQEIIEGDESSAAEDNKEVENENEVKEKQNSEASADVLVTQKTIEGDESSVVEDIKEVEKEKEVKEKQDSETCADVLVTQTIVESDESSVVEDKEEVKEKEVEEKQNSEACADVLATQKIVEVDESRVVEDKEVEKEKEIKEKQRSEACADVLATKKIIEGDESSVVDDNKEVENEKEVKEKQDSEACADVLASQKVIEGDESSAVEDNKEVENEKEVKEKQNSEACADALVTRKIIEGDESSAVEDNKEAKNENDDKTPAALHEDKDEVETLDQVVLEIVSEPIKESEKKEPESTVKEKEAVEVSVMEPATQVTDKTIEPSAEDKKEGNGIKDDKPTLSETSKDPTIIEPPKQSDKEPELNVYVSAGEVSSERTEGGSTVEDVAPDKKEMKDEKLNLSETNRDATVTEPTKETKEEAKLEVKEKENIEANLDEVGAEVPKGEESGVKDFTEVEEAENIKDYDKPALSEQEESLIPTSNAPIKESQKEADELEVKEKEKVVAGVEEKETETIDREGKRESKNMGREGAAKQSSKQSNNIISKVKQSFVKAKKAIIGKSSTPKTVSNETKGEIKVK